MNKIEVRLRNKSGIYMFTNLVNGKRYVGSSIDIYNRLHEHLHNLGANKAHNKHFQASWNKHTKDNFIYGILEFCDAETRFEREQHYIDSLCPEYNLTMNVVANFGHSPSKESRDKISETLKQKYASGEISTYRQQHNWKKTYIYNIETMTFCGEYDCINDAGKAIGFNKITSEQKKSVLRGKYIFTEIEYTNYEELVNYISEKHLTYNGSSVKYVIVEKSEGVISYYRTLSELAQDNNCSKRTLSKHMDATSSCPYIPRNVQIKFYTSNEYIPIKINKAVQIEKSFELLLGNIGEKPAKENAEIIIENKSSMASYSIEGEP